MQTTPAVPDLQNPLALEQQVCFALAVASRNVIAVYRPLLEPLGLTHPQYLVMLAMWEHQPLSVRALSDMLQLEPPTLSPLLKRLEAAGLLRREREPGNERALALTLTAKGWQLRQEALKIPPEVVNRLGMSISELMDLHRVLTRVIAATQHGATPRDRRHEKEKRPEPLTCRDSGRDLCARGDLNPHALSDTGT